MKRKRLSEEQIAFALRQAESRTTIEEICRKLGISESTFYRWKKVYAGMGVAEIRRLKQLEDENAKLKRVVADLTFGKAMSQDVENGFGDNHQITWRLSRLRKMAKEALLAAPEAADAGRERLVRDHDAEVTEITGKLFDALNEIKSLKADAGLELSREDVNLVRQWFNAVEDAAPKYLEKADRDLMKRLLSTSAQPASSGDEPFPENHST